MFVDIAMIKSMAQNKNTKKISMGSIARLAGVSTVAVSFALHNKPGVSPGTRKRILRIAKKLGYVPDARISSWMAQMREAKSKDLLPIAWLNTAVEKEAWHRYRFLTPYIEGASARALELGYKLEEIWAHEEGMTMRRLSQILYKRGIEGVVVTFPARHLRLDWDHLASVALGANLLAPKLHRVTSDLNFNLQLALKSLKRLGYKRIGICMAAQIDNASQFAILALARDFYFGCPDKDRVPPLFHAHNVKLADLRKAELIAWLKRYKPEVIVGLDGRLKAWVEAGGYRVPDDIGVVQLGLDDDVLEWAGIHAKRRETGATAIEWLVSLMRNRQFGVPKTPLNILIRGTWRTGCTLRTPYGRKGQGAANKEK